MGLLNLTSTVYGFAITLATSGINLAVVRLVSCALPYENESYFDLKADRRVRRVMKSALSYCLFFSVLASVLLFTSAGALGTYALGDKRTIPALKLLSLTLVPISLSSALNGYFCAVRRVYKNVIVQICEQGAKITVVTSLLLIIAPKGLEYACIAVVAGGAISEAICVVISATLYFFDRRLHRQITSDFEESDSKSRGDVSNFSSKKGFFIKEEKKPVKEETVAGVAFPIAVSAYVRSALLTLEHLAIPWGLKKSGSSTSVALSSYGILHGMVFPILLFPSAVLGAFSSLLVPELSGAHEQGDTKRIKHIVSKVFYLSLLFSIGVSGIFVCFSNELGMIIYNSKEASEYIKLLAPLIPLMYLDSAVDSMLKGLGQHLYTMRVNIADTLISTLLILILLPNMGIHGYVIVIFVMELFNTSFSIIKLLNVTGINTPIVKWVVKPIINIVLSTICARIIFNSDVLYSFLIRFFSNNMLIYVEIGLTAVLYLIFSRITGAVSSKDVRLAKSLIKG